MFFLIGRHRSFQTATLLSAGRGSKGSWDGVLNLSKLGGKSMESQKGWMAIYLQHPMMIPGQASPSLTSPVQQSSWIPWVALFGASWYWAGFSTGKLWKPWSLSMVLVPLNTRVSDGSIQFWRVPGTVPVPKKMMGNSLNVDGSKRFETSYVPHVLKLALSIV